MTYQETIDFLYQQLPVFHLIGKEAFKPGLANTEALMELTGNPHHQFRAIHVAGTNGKGSTSHMLASILQEAGYKTGLYTSPHLKDFTERIRINGQPIEQQQVVSFVETYRMYIQSINASFFEWTVAMAFHEFARQEVDIAVVEVGMGGRLDSTNVITPLLSVITNIGWDHADVLGDTLEKIAGEKAGIIKPGIPVVISEHGEDDVFRKKAKETGSPIFFAPDSYRVLSEEVNVGFRKMEIDGPHGTQTIELDLTGSYQRRNVLGVLRTVDALNDAGFEISANTQTSALRQVVKLSGLKGRWQQLGTDPLVFCDTGHNEPGIREVLETAASISHRQLWLVLGFVKDKDLGKILPLFPKDAKYVFCQPSTFRGLAVSDLVEKAGAAGLAAEFFTPDVNDALRYARKHADPNDLIVVGGSTFVVADLAELE